MPKGTKLNDYLYDYYEVIYNLASKRRRVTPISDAEMISQILAMDENLAYDTVAGFYFKKELSIQQSYPPKGTLSKCSINQYMVNGFYIGTFKSKYQRDQIDKLITMLKTKDSLLDFTNSTTIFNTMLNNKQLKKDINRKANKRRLRVDAGRNQLSVDNCIDIAIKEQSIIVGNIFREQVFSDLGIDESQKGEITLSILETEASDGKFSFYSMLQCLLLILM